MSNDPIQCTLMKWMISILGPDNIQHRVMNTWASAWMNTRHWFQVDMQQSRNSCLHVYKHRTWMKHDRAQASNMENTNWQEMDVQEYTHMQGGRPCKIRFIIKNWKSWHMTKSSCSWIGGASIGPSTPSQCTLVPKIVFMQHPVVSMEKNSKKQNGRRLYISACRIIKLASTGHK